jgi:ABC-type phosphate transport system substrate-binding protein
MVEAVAPSELSVRGLCAQAQMIVISPAPDLVLRSVMRYALAFILVAALLHVPMAGAGNLVVIVNPASGITQLTRNQVIDIFLGRHRKLPSGEVAIPIDLLIDTPERKQFYLLLVGRDLTQMSSYWARLVFSGQAAPPFPVPDARTALDLVAANPSAIAYVDRASVNSRVRVVLELKP